MWTIQLIYLYILQFRMTYIKFFFIHNFLRRAFYLLIDFLCSIQTYFINWKLNVGVTHIEVTRKSGIHLLKDIKATEVDQNALRSSETNQRFWKNNYPGVFLPVLSLRASSPPPAGAVPSPHTSSFVPAPAASSSPALDAVAVSGNNFHTAVLAVYLCMPGVSLWYSDEQQRRCAFFQHHIWWLLTS